jgi:hypothetical protein
MEIELPFELVKYLITGIDVEIGATVWPAGHERNKIGILP